MRSRSILIVTVAGIGIVGALLTAWTTEPEVPPRAASHATDPPAPARAPLAGGAALLRELATLGGVPAEESATPPQDYDRPRALLGLPDGLEVVLDEEQRLTLEDELRLTEEAIAASQRLSAHFDADGPAPARRSAPRDDVMRMCRGAGATCFSSADCCSGLSCSGGVAGYGTVGRCAAAR